MLPEIRSILGRAATNRYLLEQLIEQAPADRWDSRAEGDAWTARVHLAHLATIDTVTSTLLATPGANGFRLDGALQEQRLSAIAAVLEDSVGDLERRLRASRERLAAFLGAMDMETLAKPVVVTIPGGWPPEQQMSLRAYLGSWAEHDAVHTAAIRAAMAIPPGAQELALAARFGRR